MSYDPFDADNRSDSPQGDTPKKHLQKFSRPTRSDMTSDPLTCHKSPEFASTDTFLLSRSKNFQGADRPLECSHCTKPPLISYKILEQDNLQKLQMCQECPVLQQKLVSQSADQMQEVSRLYCASCLTSLEELMCGYPVGCSRCYDIFQDFIEETLFRSQGTRALHCGIGPKQRHPINPSAQLYQLSEDLKKTLKREEYEEAAKIRDRINALIKKQFKDRFK